MKKKLLASVLSAALLAGAVTASTSVSAVDISIPTDQFKDPTIDHSTVYYWHEGLPPTTVDGTKYPLLIVWDDTYFLSLDSAFQKELSDGWTGYAMDGQIDNGDWSHTFSNMDVKHDEGSTSKPSGWYRYNRDYSASAAGRVSELPFDFETLKNGGMPVTFTVPDVPWAIAVDLGDDNSSAAADGFTPITPRIGEAKHYALWVPKHEGSDLFSGENNWLVGEHRVYSKYYEVTKYTIWTTEARYFTSFDWYLGIRYDSVDTFTSDVGVRPLSDGNGSAWSPRPAIDLAHRTWTFTKFVFGEVDYGISTDGTYQAWVESSYPDQGRDNLKGYVEGEIDDDSVLNMAHIGSSLMTSSASRIGEVEKDNDLSIDDADSGFDVYYAEPVTISNIRTNFDVVNGQVISLDGPVSINPSAAITVKDGGVLSCSDWIINNGTIVIEPGGTLILQSNETANGQLRYGTIGSMKDVAGNAGGRILCDGTIIIMPECKICCGGSYGLQLGEGAQVVNYGAILSENLTVNGDYVIENRGSSSVVYPGWGMIQGGADFLSMKLRNTPVTGMGNLEKECSVNYSPNAIYGAGKDRVYPNTASCVTRSSSGGSGRVTEEVNRIDTEGSTYEAPLYEFKSPLYVTIHKNEQIYNDVIDDWEYPLLYVFYKNQPVVYAKDPKESYTVEMAYNSTTGKTYETVGYFDSSQNVIIKNYYGDIIYKGTWSNWRP
ncbi:MAG: hypothetical protein K5772_08240 [Clostridia bacterium]|nr:hypothetical protein [Clostridia bacterium]